MSIHERVKNQRVRVSMNVKHLCVQSGDEQLVQLNDGTYGKFPIKQITLHREGEEGESPWTRWYDLNDPEDKEAIELLEKLLAKHPELSEHVDYRVRIVGEFEGMGEPWPGYDDQDAETLKVYYESMAPRVRPPLENLLKYELGKDAPDQAKIVTIEAMDKAATAAERKNATAGVKL